MYGEHSQEPSLIQPNKDDLECPRGGRGVFAKMLSFHCRTGSDHRHCTATPHRECRRVVPPSALAYRLLAGRRRAQCYTNKAQEALSASSNLLNPSTFVLESESSRRVSRVLASQKEILAPRFEAIYIHSLRKLEIGGLILSSPAGAMPGAEASVQSPSSTAPLVHKDIHLGNSVHLAFALHTSMRRLVLRSHLMTRFPSQQV